MIELTIRVATDTRHVTNRLPPASAIAIRVDRRVGVTSALILAAQANTVRDLHLQTW